MNIGPQMNIGFKNLMQTNTLPNKQIDPEQVVPKSKEDFVSLINSLNESIKEYAKVSKSSFMESHSILLSYEKQAQSILNFIQRIIKTNSYNNLSDFFTQISKTLEVISLMKINNNSNNNNLNLFLDDAKILFKQMKQAKHKENEKFRLLNNNNAINQYEQVSTESNCFNNSSTQPYTGSNNSHRIRSLKENSNLNMINNIYGKLMKLINNLGEYDYIISNVDFENSNKFNILKNSIKKELENLMLWIKKAFGNNFEFMKQNESFSNIKDNNMKRNKSINSQRDIEKFKKMAELNNKKIIEFNNQIATYNRKVMELENLRNNLNMKLKNAEQLIQEKDMIIMNLQNNSNNFNNSNDLTGLNNQKDMIISNLQKQLNVFQKNEKALNIQINSLNSQFQDKIGQYEYKLSTLSETIKKQKNFIAKLQKDLQLKINQIENLNLNQQNLSDMPPNNYQQMVKKLQNDLKNKDMMIKQYENKIYELEQNDENEGGYYGLNKKLEILNLELKEKESKINAMNEELINYQRKEQIDRKQIEEMNKQILTKENVIKKKDELINNNSDNNDLLKIKLENEQLKRQLEELSSKSNNYSMQKQELINGNININNAQDSRNQDLINKLDELYKENKILLESKIKLESDISKKNEELEGLQTFILKLQNQLERSNEMNNKFSNKKELIKPSKNLNKSFDTTNDSNTNIMNKYLDQLNDANKTITQLQNQNKELKYKLEEKEVEKEFSGYRTDGFNMSNYEEEFDLKKMVNGARDKNRSEDINIDYPGVQSIKDKYKELVQNMNLLQEQVKILISNISINNKIKPQVSQICQLMKIPPRNVQNILAGKDKKKMLGLL